MPEEDAARHCVEAGPARLTFGGETNGAVTESHDVG